MTTEAEVDLKKPTPVEDKAEKPEEKGLSDDASVGSANLYSPLLQTEIHLVLTSTLPLDRYWAMC